MKKLSILLNLFVFAISVFAATPKKPKADVKAAAVPKVLFGFTFDSKTPGIKNAGWFIDSAGNIKSYEIQFSTAVKLKTAVKGYISKKDLERNYKLANIRIGTLEKEFLAGKSKLIKPVMEGPYPDKVDISAASMESITYCCYYWNSNKKKYREILLKESGRRQGINGNVNAAELIEWLESIESTRQTLKQLGKKVTNEKK